MIVIRLYNCADQDTEGTVTVFKKLRKAYILNLNEEIAEEIEEVEDIAGKAGKTEKKTGLRGDTLHVQLKAAQILSL